MGSSAIKGGFGAQQCGSDISIEKKDDQAGALAETKQGSVPRAQFLSVTTSCFKEIGSRICKALGSAVNAVNRARGAWSLASINSGHGTPQKSLSEIKFLEKLIGSDDERLNDVIKWGTENLSKPECTLKRLVFERGAAAALVYSVNDKQLKLLVGKENHPALTAFYQKLCEKLDDHYKWVINLQNAKNGNVKNRQ